MAITIKIKGDDTINFEHLKNLSEEFYGRAFMTKPYTLLVEFDNNGYAKEFSRRIEPYLKHLQKE